MLQQKIEVFALLVSIFSSIRSSMSIHFKKNCNIKETEMRNEAWTTSLKCLQAALKVEYNAVTAAHIKTINSSKTEIGRNNQNERRDILFISRPEVPTVTSEVKPKEILQVLLRSEITFITFLFQIF